MREMTSSHRLSLAALLALTSLTSACAVDAALLPAASATEAAETQLEATRSEPKPSVSSTPTAPVPEPAGIARLAISTWLGVPEQRVQIVLVESVEWPDASLGCPQPGMGYAPVVTPGFRFTLEAGGRSYFVHTDLSDAAIACTEDGLPLAPVLPVVPGEIDDGQPWMPVY